METISTHGDNRSEASFTFNVENFGKVEDAVLSPPCMIRNLPWQIKIMGVWKEIPGGSRIKSLGFFLQCNGESDSTAWSCYARARLTILSQTEGVENITKRVQHLFYSKESDWGFLHFMAWNDVIDPDKGFIKNDTVVFQVEVNADPPHGVNKNSGKPADVGSFQLSRSSSEDKNSRAEPRTTTVVSENRDNSADSLLEKPVAVVATSQQLRSAKVSSGQPRLPFEESTKTVKAAPVSQFSICGQLLSGFFQQCRFPSKKKNSKAEHRTTIVRSEISDISTDRFRKDPVAVVANSQQPRSANVTSGQSGFRIKESTKRDAAAPNSQSSQFGDDRSEASFTFIKENFSKVEDAVLSPPCMIRNLPWQIKIMRSWKEIPGVLRLKSLGFFLQCNRESDSTAWSCYARARLTILSQTEGVEDRTKRVQHLFYSKESDWGFLHFMAWNDVIDPDKGFIKNDTVVFHVEVTADRPHGVTGNSAKPADVGSSQLSCSASKNENSRVQGQTTTVTSENRDSSTDALLEEPIAAVATCQKSEEITSLVSWDDQKLCKVCIDNAANLVILPCGHVCLCDECGLELKGRRHSSCPICRSNIESTHKIYFS